MYKLFQLNKIIIFIYLASLIFIKPGFRTIHARGQKNKLIKKLKKWKIENFREKNCKNKTIHVCLHIHSCLNI